MDQQTKELIENNINTNEVCLFMKGTPDAPECGFSMAVSNMLKILEVNFKGINVLENQSLREGIKVFSDWPTIPQLYVKKEFVGGCDIVKEMFEKGDKLTPTNILKSFAYAMTQSDAHEKNDKSLLVYVQQPRQVELRQNGYHKTDCFQSRQQRAADC